MKKFLFIIFPLCVTSVFAQNYQNICTTGTTLYKPVSTYLKGIPVRFLVSIGK